MDETQELDNIATVPQKSYFYVGTYMILGELPAPEMTVPMSGVFSVDEGTSPVLAYRALESEWKSHIIANFKTPIDEGSILVHIQKFEIIE